MANFLTKSFFEDVLNVYVDLGSNLKVMLLTELAAPSINSNLVSIEDIVAFEVAESGEYVAGGKELENLLVVDQTKLVADNVVWANTTITARYCVLYDDTNPLPESKRVICVYDFLNNQSSVGAIFEIAWSTNGIINLEQQ